MRRGLLAIPLYLCAVGIGHIALAVTWYDRTTGLPRDGQAFSGTMVLGAAFVLLGLIATPVMLLLERSVAALAFGSLSAFLVAASVVAYTASRGYLFGGTSEGTPCIPSNGPSDTACVPPGGPTYIADAQPDLSVMLLASIGAYALAHVAMRLRLASARRAI